MLLKKKIPTPYLDIAKKTKEQVQNIHGSETINTEGQRDSESMQYHIKNTFKVKTVDVKDTIFHIGGRTNWFMEELRS